MTTKDKALKMALEALQMGCPPDCKDGMTDSGGIYPWGEPALIPCPNCAAITAIREALAQPAGERGELCERICTAIKAADDKSTDEAGYMLDSNDCIKIVREQFAALLSSDAQPSEWVGLSDEEIGDTWVETGLDDCDPHGFARAIEARLHEKNAGKPAAIAKAKGEKT